MTTQYFDTDSMHLTIELPQEMKDKISIAVAGDVAFSRSVDAHFGALDISPLNPEMVGQVVGLEAMSQRRKEIAERDKLARRPATKLKTPSSLGCYVEGALRFQSKDHAAVHAYAQEKMDERYSVWVAPVGSFVA